MRWIVFWLKHWGAAMIVDIDSPLQAVGLELDSLRASIGRFEGSANTGSLHEYRTAITPAALIPSLPGEPVRADTSHPAHPRGIGEPWPQASQVDSCALPGRMPLPYAWSMLRQSDGPKWNWCLGVQSVGAAEAIAAVCDDLVTEHSVGEQAPVASLVIPNDTTEFQQQRLIDAARYRGLRLSLIWRPIAAALQWLDQHPDVIRVDIAAPGQAGTLACLHLGLDRWEFTLLDLVVHEQDGDRWLLPARHRPKSTNVVEPGFGLALAHWLVKQTLDEPSRSATDAEIWRHLWCEPRAGQLLDTLLGLVDGEHANPAMRSWPEFVGAYDVGRTSTDLLFADRLDMPLGDNAVERFTAKCRRQLAGRQVTGALVTGPLAGLIMPSGSKHGAIRLKQILGTCDHVIIEPEGVGPTSLAGQAARSAAMIRDGMPVYLDTLPEIAIAAKIKGMPSWVKLTTEDYVLGGRVWRRPENHRGLRVPQNAADLSLPVAHEEFATVREVTATFENQTDRAVPVELSVEVIPAGGNASLELIPEQVGALGRGRVFLEWRRMAEATDSEGNPLAPEDWLGLQTITFPLNFKRASEVSNWPEAEHWMSRCLGRLTRSNLASARRTLRSKQYLNPSRLDYERNATLIDSEGSISHPTDLVDEFVDRLVTALPEVGAELHTQIVFALAPTSTGDRRFLKWLHQQIKSSGSRLSRECLLACGWCLRDSKAIADYAQVMAIRLNRSLDGVKDWLKAFEEMLRYREDALEFVEDGLCLKIAEELLEVFRQERLDRNLKFIARSAAQGIGFLLRRRRYSPGFLPGTSELAVEIDAEFRKAIDAIRRGRIEPIGGTINLRRELERFRRLVSEEGVSILELRTDD